MQTLTILLTGVGAPGTKGTIFSLRNNPERVPIRLIGVDNNVNAVGKYFVDAFYPVPRANEEGYLEQLMYICEVENVQVIIPQTTLETEFLSVHKPYLEAIGIKVLTSSAEAIRVANNKALLLSLFSSLGLPYPKFRVASSKDELLKAAEELGYPHNPVVVKPPVSNGMRGFRILMEDYWDATKFLEEKPDGVVISLGELSRILSRGPQWPTLIVMEYLPGAEYTVDVFRGEKAFVAVPRLRQVVRSGISFVTVTELREDIVEQSRIASEALDLRLAFGFQFKMSNDGIPKLLECNPRIQGTMVAATFAGLNLIWFSVKELLGHPVEPEQISPVLSLLLEKRVGFYRYWGGVGVLDESVLGVL